MVLVSVTMFFAGSGNPPELVYRTFTREVSSSSTQNTHGHTLLWRRHPAPTSEISCSLSLNPLTCKRAKDLWVLDSLKRKKLSFLCLYERALFQVYNKHLIFHGLTSAKISFQVMYSYANF